MVSHTSLLKILPVNKTTVFCSPIEGDYILVRTGTVGDGSCLFHALLHSYSKEYVAMSENERMGYVEKLRATMADRMDFDKWKTLGKGVVSKIPFQENIIKLLTNFYKFMSLNSTARGKNIRRIIKKLIQNNGILVTYYQTITQLIPLEEFEQTILPKAYQNDDDCVTQYRQNILKETTNYFDQIPSLNSLEPNKMDYVKSLLSEMVIEIVKEAEKMAYKSYIDDLKNTHSEVDSFSIDLISDKFDRDIYFIDSKTRMPYQNASWNNLKKRTSVLILWIGGNHYEIVGRLLRDNKIIREFDHHDSLIQKLYHFMRYPEEIPKKFPELTIYLPKKYQTSSQELSHPVSCTNDESDSNEEPSKYASSEESGSEKEHSSKDASSDYSD
jgi:hypothetical protein